MLFSESPYYGGLATLFPKEGGYAGFLHGKVVDMLYFPMFKGIWPDWMPYTGGRPYLFFKPVFNIADLSITTGVLHILLFQRHFFKSHTAQAQPEPTETLPASEAMDGIAEQAEADFRELIGIGDRPNDLNADVFSWRPWLRFPCRFFLQKRPDSLHRLVQFLIIDPVMNILSIPFGFYQIGHAKNAKMLRRNGLLELQGAVDLVHVNGIVLVDKLQDL